jgi:hypothetical protein
MPTTLERVVAEEQAVFEAAKTLAERRVRRLLYGRWLPMDTHTFAW